MAPPWRPRGLWRWGVHPGAPRATGPHGTVVRRPLVEGRPSEGPRSPPPGTRAPSYRTVGGLGCPSRGRPVGRRAFPAPAAPVPPWRFVGLRWGPHRTGAIPTHPRPTIPLGEAPEEGLGPRDFRLHSSPTLIERGLGGVIRGGLRGSPIRPNPWSLAPLIPMGGKTPPHPEGPAHRAPSSGARPPPIGTVGSLGCPSRGDRSGGALSRPGHPGPLVGSCGGFDGVPPWGGHIPTHVAPLGCPTAPLGCHQWVGGN